MLTVANCSFASCKSFCARSTLACACVAALPRSGRSFNRQIESLKIGSRKIWFANADGALVPGMFVTVDLDLGSSRSVVTLPASSISYAPYGDSVFVVGDMKDPGGASYRGVRQQFVKLGESRGDQIAVVSGLKPGDEVVTSGVFKLRNGAPVLVNNKVRPANNPAPKPENS